jgi:hypothetical protein
LSGGIYLVRDSGGLVEMTEQAYDSEDLLQELLADYPNLLAGDQIDAAAPRRWLLVSREMSLASEEYGAGRWSVDHLFLDQDAIPTIVEVKRSTDTRIRREVVGQMLDYAANAVVYWPVDRLRAQFEAGREDPEQTLLELLEDTEANSEEFWQKVKTNLQAGKVRLVFVSDEIPTELRRIVEFLNQQMDPAEVLAVEIKQYISQTSKLKTLIPRVIGQTVEAQQRKTGSPRGSKQWNESSFFHELEVRRGPEEAAVARKLLEWGKSRTTGIWWGKGGTDGAFFPDLSYKGNTATGLRVFGVYAYGSIEIQFQHLQSKPPFDNYSERLELLQRLNEIPAIDISTDKLAKRPSFGLSTLKDEAILARFLDTLDWAVEKAKLWEQQAG